MKTAKLQRRGKKTAVKSKPRQRFQVKHEREEDFDAGLRTYAKYRDLDLAKATAGMVQAHVIKMVPPNVSGSRGPSTARSRSSRTSPSAKATR